MTRDELMRKIPRYYSKSGVMLSLMQTCADEINNSDDFVAAVMRQFFASATDVCVGRWEREIGIPPNAALSAAERRERVILKLRGVGTVTVDIMSLFCSRFLNMSATAVEDNANYRFWLDVAAGLTNAQKNALLAAVEEIKPAHLGIGIRETLTPGIFIAPAVRVSEKYTVVVGST